MGRHTPGPWRVVPAGTEVPHYDICPRVVGTKPSGRTLNDPPSDADARLIAAAPELLEALRKVARESTGYDGLSRLGIINKIAVRALAKAEGE